MPKTKKRKKSRQGGTGVKTGKQTSITSFFSVAKKKKKESNNRPIVIANKLGNVVGHTKNEPPTNKTKNLDVETTTTTTGRAAGEPAADDVCLLLLNQNDLWVNHIFAFVGPGHYLFVARVCRLFRDRYKSYFDTINPKDIPKVRNQGKPFYNAYGRLYFEDMVAKDMIATNTTDTAIFSSVSMAKYWFGWAQAYFDKYGSGEVEKLRLWNPFNGAAKSGCIEVCQWAQKEGFNWKNGAWGGDWLYRTVISTAARFGHLKILKYAYYHGGRCNNFLTAAGNAVQHRRLDILKFIFENRRGPWSSGKEYRWLCSVAARFGRMECLQHIHENGHPWDKETCTAAARNGNLEILKYAHDNGCPWDEETCHEAVTNNHIEVLKYAIDKGCPWNGQTCVARAVRGGSLEVLKYLCEIKGCPLNADTCSLAASFSHLEILKYAREQGYPWDRRTFDNAETMEILTYARDNGCPGHEDYEYFVRRWRVNQMLMKWKEEEDNYYYVRTSEDVKKRTALS